MYDGMGQGEKNCGFSVPGGGKSNLNWKMFKLSRAGFLNGDVEKKKKERMKQRNCETCELFSNSSPIKSPKHWNPRVLEKNPPLSGNPQLSYLPPPPILIFFKPPPPSISLISPIPTPSPPHPTNPPIHPPPSFPSPSHPPCLFFFQPRRRRGRRGVGHGSGENPGSWARFRCRCRCLVSVAPDAEMVWGMGGFFFIWEEKKENGSGGGGGRKMVVVVLVYFFFWEKSPGGRNGKNGKGERER